MLAPSSLMASPCNYNCLIFSFFFCSIVASQCSKKRSISHHCSKTCPGCRQDSARLRFRELTWAYSAGWRIFRLHIFGCMWAYMGVYGHIRQVRGYIVYIYLGICGHIWLYMGIFGRLVVIWYIYI